MLIPAALVRVFKRRTAQCVVFALESLEVGGSGVNSLPVEQLVEMGFDGEFDCATGLFHRVVVSHVKVSILSR